MATAATLEILGQHVQCGAGIGGPEEKWGRLLHSSQSVCVWVVLNLVSIVEYSIGDLSHATSAKVATAMPF